MADVVVVNTCSVTSSADQAARQTVRRIARSNPDAKIVVTGCYATRRPDEVRELPNVIRLVPNDEKRQLVELSTAERFGTGEGSCGAAIEPGRCRPDGVHAARANRLRRALHLLHYSHDPRPAAQRADR